MCTNLKRLGRNGAISSLACEIEPRVNAIPVAPAVSKNLRRILFIFEHSPNGGNTGRMRDLRAP
jgi:hypothetical protein